jgi:ParB family transcriptional regulator, chromosome partitioning protein
MAKLKGLGRGLDALLMPASAKAEPDNALATGLRLLSVKLLKAGKYQPRSHFDQTALDELAASIKAQGLMQPIVVRALAGSKDQFEIIAGERRFRAAQLAGLTEVPVLLREADDQATLALALIENVQRQDLNALEEARALKRLHQEFGLSHEQVAQAVGRSRSAVSNLLRLTELAQPVQEKLMQGQIDMGHARALASLEPAQQILLAEKIVAQGLNVRSTEALVAKQDKAKVNLANKAKAASKDHDVARLEEELAEQLGAYVMVKQGREGSGELVIRYASLEQLEGIIAVFKRER